MMWTCQLRYYLPRIIFGSILLITINVVNGAGDLWSLERPDGMPTIQSLEVMCGKDHMDVHLAFSQPFEGIVSSKGQHGDPRCMYVPPSTGQTFFSFKIAYSRCGTKPDLHGQFYENTVVVQYDKDLLEVWDEAKRLRCEWFNDYEKTASKPPMVIADLDVVQLDFRGDNVDCWMEIQHGKGPWAPPVSGIVPLGSTLTLVVAINDYRGEFDMRVKSCIASDGGGHVIELSDEFGCVLRPKMISRFSKAKGVDERASVITYAFFHAFKFPDALSVHIKCKVEICRHGCLDHCQLQQNNNIYDTSGVGGAGLDHDLFLNPLDRKDDDKMNVPDIKDSFSDSSVNQNQHQERVYDDDILDQRNEAISHSSSSSEQQLSSGMKIPIDLNKETIKNTKKKQQETNTNNNDDDDSGNDNNADDEDADDENEVNENEKDEGLLLNDHDRQHTLGELNDKDDSSNNGEGDDDDDADEDLHAEEIRVIPETHKIKDILDIMQFPHGPRSLRNPEINSISNDNNSSTQNSSNDSKSNDITTEKNRENKEAIMPLGRVNRTRRSMIISDRKVRSADVGVSGIYEVISEADLAFSPDNRAEAVAVFQGKIREEVVYGICMPVPGFSILFVLVAVSAIVSALVAGTLLYRYQMQKQHFTTHLEQNENHFISMNLFSNWIGMKLLRPSVYATHLRRPDSTTRPNNNNNSNNNNSATVLNKSMCTNRNSTSSNNCNSINNCK